MKRHVKIDKVQYTLTYDEYGILDTVVVTGTEDCLSTKNKVVKKLVNNANKIANYEAVSGVTYVRN